MNGEVLVIHNVTRYCGDIYECIAFNGVPPAVNHLIRVEVKCEYTDEVTRSGDDSQRLCFLSVL